MSLNNPSDKIIVAIDGMDRNEAISFLKGCPDISWIKVGLELFTKEGPTIIKIFKDMDKKIFLDLKFHDIPNTMSSASYHVSKLGVDIISLHASAGLKALQLSKEAILKGAREINNTPPQVIAITVLTSISPHNFKYELNRKSSIEDSLFNSYLKFCGEMLVKTVIAITLGGLLFISLAPFIVASFESCNAFKPAEA